MTRQLHLQVGSGLCNRLRTLVSAVRVCRECDRALAVYWPPGLRTQPGDLWAKMPFTLLSRPIGGRRMEEAEMYALVSGPQEIVSLYSISRFGTDMRAYDLFELQPALQQRVDDFLAANLRSWPRIGVHVRINKAHEKTRARSPVSWFESRIPQLRAEYPTASWFLCTDDARTSRRLHGLFPGLLTESSTPPAYNSRSGVEKGMVDLHILGHTDYLLGSEWSSFTNMAGAFQTGDYGRWHGETSFHTSLPVKPCD